MEIKVDGRPAFGYLHVDLAPGESFIAESDAMASMSAEMEMKAKFNGGFFRGVGKKMFAGESLFVNEFSNPTQKTLRLTLTQGFPGDIMMMDLKEGENFYMQPGAYICSEKSVKLKMKWAGFHSWFGGEGLFRLKVEGPGKFVFGAYGGLIEKEIDGELIVDTDHLVAYPPGFEIKTQLSGGLISSFTSGEGFVMRVKGKGKVILQTRSFSGLASWINRNL